MVRWIILFCFILTVIKVSASDLPDEIECSNKDFIASEFNCSDIDNSVDSNGQNPFDVCVCNDQFCLPLCCPIGSFLMDDYDECEPMENMSNPKFPLLPVNDFHVFVRDPCKESMAGEPFELDSETNPFKLLANGTIILLPNAFSSVEETVHFTMYCFAAFADNSDYKVRLCADNCLMGNELPHVHVQFGLIISIPCLFFTFVVYAFIHELKKTMHGATLRPYLIMLMMAYISLVTAQIINPETMNINACIILGFVIHFSFLASFFWLNVMCFDIWWTFGGFRSLQGSVKQRERKKFIIYSAYAWGCPLFMTGICLIMEFVPSVPSSWIRPEFGMYGCWIHSDAALGIYFYGPMGLTVICNIFLFISTALKIVQHKKDTAHHLKGMDSRRHDDHKQWFNLYLKLFIVMGINWSMEIVSWIFKNDSPHAMWIITDLANALQGLIIFIIFVWKDKIKRLLLKRLGFRDRNFKSGNSSRSAYHSSASRTTCTTATALAPLQEKNKYCSERMKNVTDESDCV